MNKKKKSEIYAIIIVVVGVGAIAGLFIYLNSIRDEELFHVHMKSLAQRLYSDIMDRDYINDYPDSAMAVLELNNKINRLLYGDILLTNDLVPGLVEKQRMLCANALLEMKTYDQQVADQISAINTCKSNNTVCYDISIEPLLRQHPDHDNLIVAEVVWQTSNMGKIYWLYILEENTSGQFKIRSFEPIEKGD